MERVIIEKVLDKMKGELSEIQLKKLSDTFNQVLSETLLNQDIDYIEKFISAKKIEGCSDRTEEYYKQTLLFFKKNIFIDLSKVTTDDIRKYLTDYQRNHNCSNVTLDNIRRILSSFYKWLEAEDYVLKSPMHRIHKVKAPVLIKTTYSDEEIEILRNSMSTNLRNLSILNLLSSSGIRVGELVKLNKSDINFSMQTGVVKGKGNKERIIYFDAKTKISLLRYLNSRDDDNDALFVSLRNYDIKHEKRRITINNIESIIREKGKSLHLPASYPHKFRRTIATKAIDKGMPIEQVQILLGHSKIDTTLRYAQVQQKNVLYSYRKYIG